MERNPVEVGIKDKAITQLADDEKIDRDVDRLILLYVDEGLRVLSHLLR
jgi:hypothetical protein